MKNDFYIFLKSDASIDLYPENTQHSFKVRLREPIDLTGNWLCAVQQIQTVFDFDNVTDGRFEFSVGDGTRHQARIPEGRYDTIDNLLTVIQAQIDATCLNRIKLTHDPISNRIVVVLLHNSSILFRNDLAWILGFRDGVEVNSEFGNAELHDTVKSKLTIEDNGIYAVANNSVDLLVDYHHLLLYTDLIQPQLVGNYSAELLRIIDVKTIDGRNYSSEFVRPYYFPLKRNNFQVLEIFIRRESGRIPIFKKGKLNLVLHLKRNNLLL